jgi:hypothetical protein
MAYSSKRHLEDLEVLERRNQDGDGGWYVFDIETLMTLCGPFRSERDARRSAVAIEQWGRDRSLREGAPTAIEKINAKLNRFVPVHE